MSGMRLKIGPTTAISTIGATQPTKIAAQHLTTLIRQDPSHHVKPMVQARIGIQVIQRTQRARLGVARAIHAAPHARVNHKACAHAAGFQRHAHHYGADRHLAHRRGGTRLRQRLAHELLIDSGARHRSPSLLQIQNDAIITTHGEMAERLNAAVLKTVERESVPGVRLPLSPPLLVMHRRHGPLKQCIAHIGYLRSTLKIVARFPPYREKTNNTAGDKLRRRLE